MSRHSLALLSIALMEALMVAALVWLARYGGGLP